MRNILTKEDVEMTIPITLLVYYTNSPPPFYIYCLK